MSQKGNKREDILKASMKIFAQKGFHNTKVDDIALEAGIGKGTVYQYFESKIHLFEEMVFYYIEIYKLQLIETVNANMSFKDKLLKLAINNSKHMAEHFNMVQKLDVRADMISEKMKKTMINKKREMYDVIGEMFDEAIKKGEVRKDLDKEVVIPAFFGAINGYCATKHHEGMMKESFIDPTPVVLFLEKALYE